MNFTKLPLTFEQQADLLIQRGMIGDRDLMAARLASVNYYRLSGYWVTFRNANPVDPQSPLDTFKDGTTFDEVWKRYAFDRRLRLLMMDAIERIEVTVRTQLAYHHAHDHGPFAYATDPASFPKFNFTQHNKLIQSIQEEAGRSKEAFVAHFRVKYGSAHPHLPVWMAAEIMSFGTVQTFFRGASHKVKQNVASAFGLPDKVFESWLMTLGTIRNICAHHARLWNRELGVKPIIPRIDTNPDWHTPIKVQNNRIFSVLTICLYCLGHNAPQSGWPDRLRALLAASPHIPLVSMRFPTDWEKCPIWIPPALGIGAVAPRGKGVGSGP